MSRTSAGRARTTSAVLAAALVAGCAGMSEADCRGVNWYDVGYRDARFKLQNQDAVYVQQCERYGIKIDVARYGEGFRQGRWDFPDRTPL
jgi:hypothetical protein